MTDSTKIRRHGLTQSVATSLREDCGIQTGDRLLVAVSGGADSTALLLALHALAQQAHWSLDLHVAHVNHHLRAAANDDAIAVAKLAKQLTLPFLEQQIRPRDNEDEARRMRYAALADMAKQVDADAVATAHHADDQLETLIMRMIRGTSAVGLRGIRPRRKLIGMTVIRPMLRTTHAEAESLCDAAGATICDDETNRDVSRWRARLRADVLPVLRDMRPSAAIKASEAADAMADAAGLVHRYGSQLLRRHVQLTDQQATLPRTVARAMPFEAVRLIVLRTSHKLGVGGDHLPARTVAQIARAIIDDSGETRTFTLSGVDIAVTAQNVTWQKQ